MKAAFNDKTKVLPRHPRSVSELRDQAASLLQIEEQMAAQARLFYFDEADDRIDLESTEDLLGAYKSTVLSSKTHLKVVLLEGTEPLPSAPSGRGNPTS